MTTGVRVTPKDDRQDSMAILERETHRIRMQESRKIVHGSREAITRRSNERPLIVRRRPAKCKDGLTFCSLGPWGR